MAEVESGLRREIAVQLWNPDLPRMDVFNALPVEVRNLYLARAYEIITLCREAAKEAIDEIEADELNLLTKDEAKEALDLKLR